MERRVILIARFDGGCFPNPGGHASCAMLIERDGVEVARESKYLGHGAAMTCNVAEYGRTDLWRRGQLRPEPSRRFFMAAGSSYSRGTNAPKPEAGVFNTNLPVMPPFRTWAALRYAHKRGFAEMEARAWGGRDWWTRTCTKLPLPATAC